MISIIDALIALVPGSEDSWSVNGNFDDIGFEVTTNQVGINIPTKEQIELKFNELKIADAKTQKKAIIDKWSYVSIGADLNYEIEGVEHVFQTNYFYPPPEDNREIITVSMLGRISIISENETVPWITKANISVNLTKMQMREILNIFFTRQTQVILQARAYKDEVASLETLSEVLAFQID